MRIARPEETKEMYEKNLALLSPWLKETVSRISEEELHEKVEIIYSDEGYPVCRYRRGNICFHVTGEHPIRDAKLWYQSIEQDGSVEIFLYGTGFGYELFELFAHKAPNTLVVVFEQDLYLFKAMLYYFDLSPLIETQKITFLVGDCQCFQKAFEELFYSVLFFSTTYPTVVFSKMALRNFKKEYLEIHRYVLGELSLLTSYLGNDHQDNMIGLQNMLANTRAILENPYVSCLKDKYKNIPAFIVSNGPSLDQSIRKLKEIQGRGLMICVESAIVPLTKNGIHPDILTVVERTTTTYQYHFANRNYSPDITLIALALVDPRVFQFFGGEKIPIFRKGEDLNRWFNRNLSGESEMDAGANVSHLAVGLAMHLGADPIILVGQDFAYGPRGVTHSKDAVISQKQEKKARDRIHSIPTVYVEGNNGKMIPSNQLWEKFRLGMEHIIAEHPEHHFYNTTEGGAKVHGADRAELGGLIEQYCTQPLPYRVNELAAQSKKNISLNERKTRLENFITEVEHYTAMFRNVARETNLKKLETEKMMLLCMEKNYEKNRDILNEAYQKNTEKYYQYMSEPLCRSFFQQLICAYFYLLNHEGSIDTQEKRVRIFDIQRQFFRDLHIVSQSLSVTLEEAVEPLQTLLEELRIKAVQE